jgi:hypothetical protein
VQYIRFARRALGVKPAQTVFTKARKADADSHHVYLCMTQIEHIANKSPATAAKIFAAGLKKHSEQPVFVKAYIDFLYQTGDDGNLRLLFEKILKVSTVQEKETKTEAWNEFLDFEYTFAKDVQSIHHIESRRASAFHLDPQRSRVASLLYRYHFEVRRQSQWSSRRPLLTAPTAGALAVLDCGGGDNPQECQHAGPRPGRNPGQGVRGGRARSGGDGRSRREGTGATAAGLLQDAALPAAGWYVRTTTRHAMRLPFVIRAEGARGGSCFIRARRRPAARDRRRAAGVAATSGNFGPGRALCASILSVEDTVGCVTMN